MTSPLYNLTLLLNRMKQSEQEILWEEQDVSDVDRE